MLCLPTVFFLFFSVQAKSINFVKLTRNCITIKPIYQNTLKVKKSTSVIGRSNTCFFSYCPIIKTFLLTLCAFWPVFGMLALQWQSTNVSDLLTGNMYVVAGHQAEQTTLTTPINCQNLDASFKQQLVCLHNTCPLCKHVSCTRSLESNFLLHKGHYSTGSIILQHWPTSDEAMKVYKTNYFLASCNNSNPTCFA